MSEARVTFTLDGNNITIQCSQEEKMRNRFIDPKIDIDILSNLEKDMVNKTLNVFIYYYLFQSECSYNRYFDFVLIVIIYPSDC